MDGCPNHGLYYYVALVHTSLIQGRYWSPSPNITVSTSSFEVVSLIRIWLFLPDNMLRATSNIIQIKKILSIGIQGQVGNVYNSELFSSNRADDGLLDTWSIFLHSVGIDYRSAQYSPIARMFGAAVASFALIPTIWHNSFDFHWMKSYETRWLLEYQNGETFQELHLLIA